MISERTALSSNIKLQELPEFRMQNAHIELSMTMKEEDLPKGFQRPSSKYYTKLKIEEAPIVNVNNNPFAQEYAGSAKSILSLLAVRDKYIFEHCQCKVIMQLE